MSMILLLGLERHTQRNHLKSWKYHDLKKKRVSSFVLFELVAGFILVAEMEGYVQKRAYTSAV